MMQILKRHIFMKNLSYKEIDNVRKETVKSDSSCNSVSSLCNSVKVLFCYTENH
jgi:hypothetical protein